MSDDNIILDPWNDNNNLLTKGDVYDIFEKAGFTNARDIITINDLSLYQTAFVHSSYVKKCIFDTLNKDGTKMFTSYFQKDGDDYYIREYNLSTPYDVSTRVYAGDSERCLIDASGGDSDVYTSGGMHDLEFSSDGMKLFFVIGNNSTNFFSGDNVYE